MWLNMSTSEILGTELENPDCQDIGILGNPKCEDLISLGTQTAIRYERFENPEPTVKI